MAWMSGENENNACELILSIHYSHGEEEGTSRRNQRSKKEHSRVCWKDQAYEREDHKKTTEKKNERENEREIVGLGNNGYQLSITWERPVKSGREWKVWSPPPKKNPKNYTHRYIHINASSAVYTYCCISPSPANEYDYSHLKHIIPLPGQCLGKVEIRAGFNWSHTLPVVRAGKADIFRTKSLRRV